LAAGEVNNRILTTVFIIIYIYILL
jgi:hypothetical protein